MNMAFTFSEEIRSYADRSVLCWLATVDGKNMPNVSPKEMFLLHGGNQVIIAHIASPQSVRNIGFNKNVCIAFIDIFDQRGYQLKGRADIISKGANGYNSIVNLWPIGIIEKYPISAFIVSEITSSKKIVAPSFILSPDEDEHDKYERTKERYLRI